MIAGCTKEFNRPDKLKAHIIAHAGAKPYRCQTCDRTFTRRPHLREHERFHAENFRFWCERCNHGFMRQNLFKHHDCAGMMSSATRPGQHAFRRKVGRPRKNVPLHADSSGPVTDAMEVYLQLCNHVFFNLSWFVFLRIHHSRHRAIRAMYTLVSLLVVCLF